MNKVMRVLRTMALGAVVLVSGIALAMIPGLALAVVLNTARPKSLSVDLAMTFSFFFWVTLVICYVVGCLVEDWKKKY